MRYRLILITLILGLTTILAACPSSTQWHLSDYVPTTMHRSIWPAMAADFRLKNDFQTPAVQKAIARFSKHQAYINELTQNAKPYIYYIFEQTQKRNMPAELALLPMIESDYNPFVYSKTGATGLWQMMPGTASGFGLRIDWWYDGRRDIVASTNAALKYLAYLHSYFGNWLLAIAAYDSGEGTVRAAIRYNRRHNKPTDYWSLPLPLETKRYVPKLLALAAIIYDQNHSGLHLNDIPNHPYFTAVNMHGQIDLNRVANLAKTNVDTVRKLNPGFRRWATIPNAQYALLIPKQNANFLAKNIDQTKEHQVTWLHHHVKRGESLSILAKTYHTTIATLQRANNIKGNMIHVGQELLIPKSFRGQFNNKIKKQKGSIAEDRLPGPQRFIHTVKSRETLWNIASRYRIKANQIRYWNHLGYHAKLKPNQKLIIWKKKNHYKTGSHLYAVKSGDNLSVIGKRFHVSVSAIKTLNQLRSNLLHIGQKLNIPYPDIREKHYTGSSGNKLLIHTVRPGQSLYTIARYYKVSTQNLINWNHLQQEKYLRLGERLKVYLTS